MDKVIGHRTDKVLKTAMAVVPVATAVAVAVVVLLALTPSGDWVTFSIGDAEYETGGAFLTAIVPVEVGSNLPYDLEGLRMEATMVDHVNGSSLSILSFDSTDIPAGGSGVLTVESRMFLPTVYLIAMDLIEQPGSVLTFELSASCSYLLGLADFNVDASLSVPLSDPEDTLVITVEENSSRALQLSFDGLADRLMPEESDYVVSDGFSSISIDVSPTTDGAVLSMHSDMDIDSTIDQLRGNPDTIVMDEDGKDVGLSQTQIDLLLGSISSARVVL